MSVIDDYLKDVSPTQKVELEHIRTLIKQMAPEVEEVISYGMPSFKYKKRILLHMAAFKDHMSIFPASDSMIKEVGEGLAKFRTGKGTLQFTESKPIPEAMLRKIIDYRLSSVTPK
jgi:uncharacterized protein YdhG (YjbR/CyaY superfamily)